MQDNIALMGLVVTNPRFIVAGSGRRIASFRLATAERPDAEIHRLAPEANWYTVVAYDQLAEHVAQSIRKGQRVIVVGGRVVGALGGAVRLVIREEVPPRSVYRVGIFEVLLVKLVDQPLVGTEVGSGLAGGGSRRLSRHGGDRPLPHSQVDL